MNGLVLEGGAFRGLYTAGVLDVFMENQITFDHTVGVSAGACFGCNIKSKQIGRVLRYNKRFCNDKRYASIKSFITTGNLYNADFAYNTVPTILDPFDSKTFKENPMKFTVVCTDVNTGNPIYHEIKDGNQKDIEWIRASSAVPIVSRIVEIDGYKMVDGGVADSIPVEWMLAQGSNKTVVVLTRDLDYKKEPIKFMKVIRKLLKNYPNLVHALETRHLRYNECIEKINELEREGQIFVIRPSQEVKTSSVEKNPEHLQEIYNLGKKDALNVLNDLFIYLNM
jgi:predicted patatin/cPLA2 family phospholipase